MISTIGEGTRLRGGRYVLEERLGTGGAATVWLAEDCVLERSVAVKVLSEALATDEKWLARFSREARMAAGLSHPNLVSVYDFNANEDRPYLVMAHMPGGSLWDLMQDGDRADPSSLAVDLLSALEAIHAAGIIHRDIKPGNVLFAADGTACLTDFGVARPEDATSLTQTGQIPGTAKFMAPELWAGHPADERSDLYAAGVVLRDAVGFDCSPELQALIDRLCAEDPDRRPVSASAALNELRPEAQTSVRPVSAGDPEAEPTPRTIFVQPQAHPRRRIAIAGVALLATVAAIAIALAIGGGDDGGSTQAGDGAAKQSASKDKKAEPPESDGGAPEAQATTEATTEAPPETVDPIALDHEGKALIDAGNPEEAIPLLQQAVDYYEEDSTDIDYAYSLYNLGNALLLAGRPDEAIPYLEKRLTWDDQRETVQQTLDDAYSAAGETPEPSGNVPPGQAKKDG
jgi:serine/threonine-protein kinase